MHLNLGGVAMSPQNQNNKKWFVSPGVWESAYEFGDTSVQITVAGGIDLGPWAVAVFASVKPCSSHALLLEQKSQGSPHLSCRSPSACLNGKGCRKYVGAGGIVWPRDCFFSLSFLTQ